MKNRINVERDKPCVIKAFATKNLEKLLKTNSIYLEDKRLSPKILDFKAPEFNMRKVEIFCTQRTDYDRV